MYDALTHRRFQSIFYRYRTLVPACKANSAASKPHSHNTSSGQRTPF
ncbi:Hypothetical protein Cp262_0297 [Corynebacterium pseudotuberculosis]|nr:Hypothetical protein Cp262_0297 [Corynebacterium pseudotuberculosis]